MKILEVMASPDLGGAERALAQRLQFQPPTVETVVLHGPATTPARVTLPRSVRTIEEEVSRRVIADAIRAEKPDIVVVHDPRNLLRTQLLRRSRLPLTTVFVMHSSFLSESRLKETLLKIPFRIAMRRTSHVVAVSRRAAEATGTDCPTTVVHLGPIITDVSEEVDHVEQFEWLQQADLRFLVLSRLTSTKNIDSLLRAIAHVRSEFDVASARLLIVGHGREEPRLKKIVERRDLQSLVGFSPATRSPSRFMSIADFLVVASSSEGGPLTVFEALRSGTRVVSTRVGVVGELAAQYPDQFILATSPKPRSLQKALRQALASGPTSHSDLSTSPLVATAFDAKTQAENFYSVIVEVGSAKTHRSSRTDESAS